MIEYRDYIEIPLSKKKLLLGVLLAMVFLVFAVPILLDFINGSIYLSTLELVVMIFTVLFCGSAAVFLIYRLFIAKNQLIINKKGISLNSIEEQLALWSDIKDIRMVKVSEGRFNSKYLIFIVENPQEFIDKNANNSSERKAMEWNLRLYGGPVYIIASAYSMKSEKLHNLLLEKMQEYKSKTI